MNFHEFHYSQSNSEWYLNFQFITWNVEKNLFKKMIATLEIACMDWFLTVIPSVSWVIVVNVFHWSQMIEFKFNEKPDCFGWLTICSHWKLFSVKCASMQSNGMQFETHFVFVFEFAFVANKIIDSMDELNWISICWRCNKTLHFGWPLAKRFRLPCEILCWKKHTQICSWWCWDWI